MSPSDLHPGVLEVVSVKAEPIAELIERSSVGAGLRNIRENGIEAELVQLKRGVRRRRKTT